MRKSINICLIKDLLFTSDFLTPALGDTGNTTTSGSSSQAFDAARGFFVPLKPSPDWRWYQPRWKLLHQIWGTSSWSSCCLPSFEKALTAVLHIILPILRMCHIFLYTIPVKWWKHNLYIFLWEYRTQSLLPTVLLFEHRHITHVPLPLMINCWGASMSASWSAVSFSSGRIWKASAPWTGLCTAPSLPCLGTGIGTPWRTWALWINIQCHCYRSSLSKAF